MWLNSGWGDSRGLACMTDVEFVTLGIIRCNVGDSMKCKIAFERVEGNRKLFDSSWCFMVFPVGPFLLWVSDHSYKNKDLLLIVLCNVLTQPSSVFLPSFLCVLSLTHTENPSQTFMFQLRFDWVMKYTSPGSKPWKNDTHFVVCDTTPLRFQCLLHDIPLILFIRRQVVVSKSHFVNQFFFRTDYFSDEKRSC